MRTAQGCTRVVFLIGPYAIKLPNPRYSWENFLKGLIANITEANTWTYNGYAPDRKLLRDELLCPVLWSSWGGWVIVMTRVEPDTTPINVECNGGEPTIEEYQIAHRKHYGKWIDAGFGGDDKQDNYGVLGGRIVKLDYGQS